MSGERPTVEHTFDVQVFEHDEEEAIVRRHDEAVQVRLGTGGSPDGQGPAPDAFLWRNRLYVVREVLATWLEREAWWETPPTAERRPVLERVVWRVEAAAGRTLGSGVYDLAQAVTTGASVPAMSGATGTDAATAGPTAGHEQDRWWLLCHLD